MKCLITGFEPFGVDAINPSQEAVLALPDQIGEITLIKAVLPVVQGEASDRLKALMVEHRPDVVVCVGQAGGRSGLTVERVAINVDDYPIPDNKGQQPLDQPIAAQGPAAYFLTLPNKAIVQAWRQAGYPASLSNTAGTFLCNHVAYAAAHFAAHHFPNTKTGFIHTPYSTAQSANHPNAFAMSPGDLKAALVLAVAVIADTTHDAAIPEGTTC